MDIVAPLVSYIAKSIIILDISRSIIPLHALGGPLGILEEKIRSTLITAAAVPVDTAAEKRSQTIGYLADLSNAVLDTEPIMTA